MVSSLRHVWLEGRTNRCVLVKLLFICRKIGSVPFEPCAYRKLDPSAALRVLFIWKKICIVPFKNKSCAIGNLFRQVWWGYCSYEEKFCNVFVSILIFTVLMTSLLSPVNPIICQHHHTRQYPRFTPPSRVLNTPLYPEYTISSQNLIPPQILKIEWGRDWLLANSFVLVYFLTSIPCKVYQVLEF